MHIPTKLNKLIKQKKVIRLVAIPRSGSTILELVLGLSPSISKIIHEPLHEFGYYDSNRDETLNKLKDELSKMNTEDIAVLKDMTHWLAKKSVYKTLLAKNNYPVIILIKDPLICLESKLKRIVLGIANRERPNFNKYLFSYLNIQNRDECLGTKKLLDAFAKSNSYSNWNKMCSVLIKTNRDYRLFEPLVSFFFSNETDIWGWDSLKIILDNLNSKSVKHIIVNGEHIQANPKKCIKKICENCNIEFDQNMLKFTRSKLNKLLNIERIQPRGYDWYKDTLKSTTVIKPSNTKIKIEMLPKSMQNYYNSTALPIYKKTLKNLFI